MVSVARSTATSIDNEDVEWCKAIGQHGLQIIKDLASRKPADTPVNILTHCNAGRTVGTGPHQPGGAISVGPV